MKTKVEIEGYEIEISFEEGMISVTAQKDDEVVEEGEEGEEGAQEGDIKGFGDYDEEEDFSDEDLQDELEGDDDDDDELQDELQDEREGAALESFQSFINKKK